MVRGFIVFVKVKVGWLCRRLERLMKLFDFASFYGILIPGRGWQPDYKGVYVCLRRN